MEQIVYKSILVQRLGKISLRFEEHPHTCSAEAGVCVWALLPAIHLQSTGGRSVLICLGSP